MAAVAVFLGVSAVAPPPPATVAVPVATHDLAAGIRLTNADLTTARFIPGTAPDGLADHAAGRVLAAPLSRGEPLTDVRLVGPALATGTDGRVATPLRLPDAAMVALLQVGDVIDLVAVDPQDGGTEEIAHDVPVLAVPAVSVEPAGGSTLPGRLVVVGITPAEVVNVADASVRQFVTYTWAER